MAKCRQIQDCPNCFARTDGVTCNCLSNTEFFKKCPFYKTKEQHEKELKEIRNRGNR